jgi:hypothetical protein
LSDTQHPIRRDIFGDRYWHIGELANYIAVLVTEFLLSLRLYRYFYEEEGCSYLKVDR